MTGRLSKPKTVVASWRRGHRGRVRLASVRPILALLATIILLALLVRLTPPNVIDTLAEPASRYSALVLTVLTLVTAGATLVYVRLTGRMLREMVEARRADVRPLLKVYLGALQVRLDSRGDETVLFLDVPVTVTNQGKGPAILRKMRVSVPTFVDEDGTTSDWQCTELKWNTWVVDPRATAEGTASFFMTAYEIPERVNDFVEFEGTFEDLHQGEFCMRQIYDLLNLRFGDSESEYLPSSSYEALYYRPFEHKNKRGERPLGWGDGGLVREDGQFR